MLNPIDHMLLATHETLRETGAAGLNVLLVLDVEGPLDAEELQRAVRTVGTHVPQLSARLRITPIVGRARLVVDADADHSLAIAYEHTVGDSDGPLQRALNDRIDPATGPQFKLLHITLGPDRHRIGLRWAHHMTDVDGAMQLLGLIGTALRGERLPACDDAAGVRDHAPFPYSIVALWRTRLRYFWWSYYRQPRIVPKPADAVATWNFRYVHMPAATCERYRAAARRRTADGPGRYARHFLGCFTRTYAEVCRQRGRPRRHYFFSFVVPTPRPPGPRGLLGTHVTIPWLRFRAADFERPGGVQPTIDHFLLTDYLAGGMQGDWLAAAAMQKWPLAWQKWFIRKRSPPGAVCLTTYRFGDAAQTFGRAMVTNIAAVGTANCHPGWVASHTTYRDRMTIGVGFRRDYLAPADVDEFLVRLEACLCE